MYTFTTNNSITIFPYPYKNPRPDMEQWKEGFKEGYEEGLKDRNPQPVKLPPAFPIYPVVPPTSPPPWESPFVYKIISGYVR